MIIISYNKQTWNEYDYNKTADENLANGGIINSDRLNHMEDGISNNDTEKVNIADMRKPASDVVGLEDVSTAVNKGLLSDGTDMHTLTNEGIYNLNGKAFVNFVDTGRHWGTIQVINQNAIVIHIVRATSNLGDHIWWESSSGQPAAWSTWHLLSDDSKVAHLSGANNFDTVPTYGNNEIPLALNNSGSTTNRPTGQVVGYQYFDTTLNKPIWYNGSSWVDSTGATV